MSLIEETAFPRLTTAEIAVLKPLATPHDFADGQTVFRAGQPDIDFWVVESGQIDILNPADDNRLIVTHDQGQFSGDIDLLTGRPVIVTGVARGKSRLWSVPGSHLRALLNRVPSLGEKLIIAFTRRRELLSQLGVWGLQVVGPGRCRDTNTVREFLYKNFVPFTWFDPETEAGQKVFKALGSPKKTPVIGCGDGQILLNPSLIDLARAAGIWRYCPAQEVDFAIVGAGPAGIAAAVYASSEGLSTLMLDRLGPGGQAGGSSRIENFIGFPAGLSGADLAMRGVLQMLKFGARIVAPVNVQKLTPAKGPDQKHVLHLDCGAEIKSRVVLLALGVRWRRLEAEGADRFTGAGIYYACTTVEADLYDGTDVAVVGAGNSAGQAIMFLAECCPTRKVHALIRRKLGPGMSEYLANRIRATANVIVHEQTEIDAVFGNFRLEGISLKSNEASAQRRLPCSAVFVFIGAEPSAEWLPPEIARDAKGYLLTGTDVMRSGLWPSADRDPCPLETTLPGVLAAGDIRAGSTKRVGFAVGDGSLAVTCAHRLLAIQP
ncbi:MAG TPA: FAD-dependent oxidoreductase [Planctomycetaceae bacterium]|jgi:thioredoxin reductase (NADPH)|nr:FAD-dependent oxidoreductase [Planctomycetaceae bacterium]